MQFNWSIVPNMSYTDCTIYNMIPVWSGKTAQIMQKDVKFLTTDKGITAQVISGSVEGIMISERKIYVAYCTCRP